MNQRKSNEPEIPILPVASARAGNRLSARLLCCEVANDGQLEFLVAISFYHAHHNSNHNAKPNHHHQRTHEENAKPPGDEPQDHGKDKYSDPDGQHSDTEEYRLKRVEPHEAVILVRFDQQENKPSDPTKEIAKTCSNIICHTSTRGARRRRSRSNRGPRSCCYALPRYRRATSPTKSRTRIELGPTLCTECHKSFVSFWMFPCGRFVLRNSLVCLGPERKKTYCLIPWNFGISLLISEKMPLSTPLPALLPAPA